MSRWYAIHTKPRQEETALAHLERQGFDCHLPRARERRRARHRYALVTLPLFPRYLFARLDLATQNTAPIRSTQGVVGLVRFGLDPAPLPKVLWSSCASRTIGVASRSWAIGRPAMHWR